MKSKLILLVPLAMSMLASTAISQCLAPEPNDGESGFIYEFRLTEGAGQTGAILQEVAGNKIDAIFGGGTESKREIGNRVFLTRRWGEEISKFTAEFSGYDFDIGVKNVIESRLKMCGFSFKPGVAYVGLYAIDYKAGSTIGSVDLRTYYDEKKSLHLEFIFHESYIKRATKKGVRSGNGRN